MQTHNRKSRLIPQKWKKKIDYMLTHELLGANRYFAQSNPKLKEHVVTQSLQAPESFLDELVERWNWHNLFFEEFLEPMLGAMLPKNHFTLTPEDVTLLAEFYRVGSLVDQATLIPTAAIKKHVEYWSEFLRRKMMLNDEEFMMLITPTRRAFWISYLADHIEYFIALDSDKADAIEAELIKRYHASDREIFEGRLEDLKSFQKLPIHVKQDRLAKLRSTPKAVEQFYFLLERPQARALAEIIAYDNDDEYRMLSSFVGISGFIFRKAVLAYLNETKILENQGAIYEFDDTVVLRGLAKLTAYRKEVMMKDMKIFRQTTGDTCAAACLVMVLHHYGLSELTKQEEGRIYDASKASLVPGTHFSGIQRCADRAGLETLLVHSDPKMFTDGGYFDRETFQNLMHEYRSFFDGQSGRAHVENGVPITTEYIKTLLEQGYVIILAGRVGGILHAVVIAGYNNGGLLVYDPLREKEKWHRESSVMVFSKTPIGSWLLAIRQPKPDRSIVKKRLAEFEIRAQKHLS